MISICLKSNTMEILDEIKRKVDSLNIKNLCCRRRCFKIFNNIIIHYSGENIDDFYKTVSNVISDVIIIYFEPLLIKRLINLNYFYFSLDDKSIILDEYYLLREKDIYNYSYVKELIFASVFNFIKNNKSLVLSGFVDFRLSKYHKYLENIVAESVNQYIIDKEYISFVNLLRNYIETKNPSTTFVNLIYINSKGILLSNSGELIKLDGFHSSYVSDISFSQNDYILNTLVGLLPNSIKVHLISPKDQFIKTIELIFTDKVHFCDGCELCKSYKMLHLK